MKLELTVRNFTLEGEITNRKLRTIKREGDLTIKGYVTTKEAAEMLSVTHGRVKQLVASGALESVLMGNTRLIPIAAVEARLRAKPPAGRPRKNRGKS